MNKLKIGIIAGAILLTGGGTVLAVQAMLPTRHELAVDAWNESNDEINKLFSELSLEKADNTKKFCQMVRIADADGIPVTSEGWTRFNSECEREELGKS